MAIIDIKINDRAVRMALARGAAAVTAALDDALEEGMDRVIADIRGNDDRLFTNPQGGLTGSLWRSGAKGGSIEGGWSGPSAIYGPVHEFGPKNPGPKKIYPKGTLSKGYGSTGASGRARRGAGAPIKALRMKIGGKVVYRRSSTYRWTPSMARPHWSWAWGRNQDWFHANIRQNVVRAVERALHGR